MAAIIMERRFLSLSLSISFFLSTFTRKCVGISFFFWSADGVLVDHKKRRRLVRIATT